MFLEDNLTAYQNEEVALNPIFNGLTYQSAQWFPEENLDCPTCLETNLTATTSGYYNVSLNVTENCLISDSILIHVKPNEIHFPSGFSPNSDGVNDVFRAVNTNLENYHLQVYNRWGEKVFESSNPSIGWDGTYKTSNAQIGVYNYVVDYKIINQENTKTSKGNITLLR